MVLLYWDLGRSVLEKQADQGRGSRVIDRLAADLREAFAEMKGFSPRNLKYMRAFAAAWPDRQIVQASLAQLPWYPASPYWRSSTVRNRGSGTPRGRTADVRTIREAAGISQSQFAKLVGVNLRTLQIGSSNPRSLPGPPGRSSRS